jgi:hypothetical protein
MSGEGEDLYAEVYDFAAFDAALPRLEPREMSRARYTRPSGYFTAGKWPLSLPYNGFTGGERAREHQVMNWIRDAGFLPPPGPCDMCGSTNRTGYHAEDYFDPWRMMALCGGCHRAIHQRFSNPMPWVSRVAEFSYTGEEWFALAPMDHVRYADWLRANGKGAPVETLGGLALPEWVGGLPVEGLTEPGMVDPRSKALRRSARRFRSASTGKTVAQTSIKQARALAGPPPAALRPAGAGLPL